MIDAALDRLFRWWYGRPYRLTVTFRWSEAPEYVKASYVITAHTRTKAAAQAVVWAQRDVDTDWVLVTVEDTP